MSAGDLPSVPEFAPLNLELAVRQLLELDPERQALAGHAINLFWEKTVGAHHPYYHAYAVARWGEDYDVNGYGDRSFDGKVYGVDD